MYSIKLDRMVIDVDFERGQVDSLKIDGKERLVSKLPLFKFRLRDEAGVATHLTAHDAAECRVYPDGAEYSAFGGDYSSTRVRVWLTEVGGELNWRISVTPADSTVFVEWVDFPMISLPKLVKNNDKGNGGVVLYPYNEGELISDYSERFEYREPEYPSMGIYCVFPNMVHSQMLSYLWDDAGLYIGLHDPKRGLKGIDLAENEGGLTLQLRLFTGVSFGEAYTTDYPIVWSAVSSKWEASAERYRVWFESTLPSGVRKVKDNSEIPEWYADSPLIITYPVRGKHDTDIMNPGKLYPYVNAIPVVKEIKDKTGSRILVVLMHWEGTAPWAPPYVWPPYGGEKVFNEFADALHNMGDMLGVYCSGFGYTVKSNLVDYNKYDEFEKRGLAAAMCHAPDGSLPYSLICTEQRVGYDICPASELGRELLWEGYKPLFESKVDYVQILDQNHGGGQYLCYSRDHGHPAAPGAWMTENMQNMLTSWQKAAPGKLFGCESSAAEPFIGNLLFSDNRYELNYATGRPVPLYAYLYHEYLRNFMGNQVCNPLDEDVSTLLYRLAYSFSIGDCMTLVINENADIMPYWGKVKFNRAPIDRELVFKLISNLNVFYKTKAKSYLYAGRMTDGASLEMDSVTYGWNGTNTRHSVLPALLASAWEGDDGTKVQIIVNPTDTDATCKLDGREVTVPALDAVMVSIK